MKSTPKSENSANLPQNRTGPSPVRRRFIFRGIVQGVGFRPAVYRCAVALGLTGFVQNRRSEVAAEVQGQEETIERFRKRFLDTLPGAAALESVKTEDIGPVKEEDFRIIESSSSDYLFPPIPPDLSICKACTRELFDPENRRYLYPFITCTQCGPRYSIVEDTPFDRETTSMIDFPQCPDCLREYTDPADRRFHSQTNSCEVCGPKLTAYAPGGAASPGPSSKAAGPAADDSGAPAASRPGPADAGGAGDPVKRAVRFLAAGKVAAVQGIGGFHLAADPSSPEALAKLRREKERRTKPFALMVRDLEEAKRLCFLGDGERRRLTSPEKPIVIMPARPDIPAHLREVSDTGTLGIMLPYTPLHLLLFFHPEEEIPYRHLIMTSGNRHDEPIITEPSEAIDRLSDVADLFVYHNRRILFRSDDSVLRPPLSFSGIGDNPKNGGGEPDSWCIIRRSRGFVPKIFTLDRELPASTLAVGGDLKNAPAFGDKNTLYLSPYIGDLEDPNAFEAFEKTIEQILGLYKISPRRVVCDLHPGYHSTAWALASSIPEKKQVQHHYAHLLSVMAEHGLEETAGASCDGTGYGTDGTVWGGEFLHATREGFRRLGSLRPFPLPGGEAAIHRPGRIAYSLLYETLNRQELEKVCGFTAGAAGDGPAAVPVPEASEAVLIREMLAKGVNAPLTSSAGRLFDAVSALLGFVGKVYYEGEGPIKLEGAAIAAAEAGGLTAAHGAEEIRRFEGWFPLDSADDRAESPDFFIDPRPMVAYLAERTLPGLKKTGSVESGLAGELALLFHEAFAHGLLRGIQYVAEETGIKTVSLSGGVFQNMLLRKILLPRLTSAGYLVRLNRNVSPGDGGIALGQAYAL